MLKYVVYSYVILFEPHKSVEKVIVGIGNADNSYVTFNLFVQLDKINVPSLGRSLTLFIGAKNDTFLHRMKH